MAVVDDIQASTVPRARQHNRLCMVMDNGANDLMRTMRSRGLLDLPDCFRRVFFHAATREDLTLAWIRWAGSDPDPELVERADGDFRRLRSFFDEFIGNRHIFDRGVCGFHTDVFATVANLLGGVQGVVSPLNEGGAAVIGTIINNVDAAEPGAVLGVLNENWPRALPSSPFQTCSDVMDGISDLALLCSADLESLFASCCTLQCKTLVAWRPVKTGMRQGQIPRVVAKAAETREFQFAQQRERLELVARLSLDGNCKPTEQEIRDLEDGAFFKYGVR